MLTSKVFTSGNSQAIRLPKEYRVDEKEMIVHKVGNTIILFPKENPWELFKQSLSEFSDDFLADGRNQPEEVARESV